MRSAIFADNVEGGIIFENTSINIIHKEWGTFFQLVACRLELTNAILTCKFILKYHSNLPFDSTAINPFVVSKESSEVVIKNLTITYYSTIQQNLEKDLRPLAYMFMGSRSEYIIDGLRIFPRRADLTSRDHAPQ